MTDPHRRDYAFMAEDPKAVTHDEQMFSGALSFCRRKYARDLTGADVAVVGVPFDASVTNRPGARFGPRAVRAASAQLGWSRFWPSAFDPFERLNVVDWGDVHIPHGRPDSIPAQIESAMGAILDAGATPLAIGGDHFTTYPALRAHAARLGRPLALVQFDAHTDTWKADPDWIDHGTMFHTAVQEGIIDPARSIQVGIRTTNDDPEGIEVYDAIKVHERGAAAAAEAIRRRVGDAPVYLTFDIDCLDPAFAPGTGTPVCGGLASWQALAILRGLSGIRLTGMDVVEVAPAYDVAEITALAGATIALQLLCLFAERP
ncbi:agmatinase [Oceanicella actignis]|uniref:Agmatinase n=1 Tax=Oceanicella actignis TaxID=1189325 RepID=A0A1M7TEN7_9RHOB|nr:agmatinase [Oceanicella actignis]TYO88588.1 agmatinase [Oceanicella actignis]SET62288.1 agmatinase [Oceanicella actignis]SHN69118.1 agmatinase [Oceanicella actignis]